MVLLGLMPFAAQPGDRGSMWAKCSAGMHQCSRCRLPRGSLSTMHHKRIMGSTREGILGSAVEKKRGNSQEASCEVTMSRRLVLYSHVLLSQSPHASM